MASRVGTFGSEGVRSQRFEDLVRSRIRGGKVKDLIQGRENRVLLEESLEILTKDGFRSI